MTVTPVITTYIIETEPTIYPYIDGGSRQVPFTPFNPTVQTRPGCFRPMFETEFTTYFQGLLSALTSYDAAWISYTTYQDCGATYVSRAGIIYKIGNTFGVWNGTSYMIIHPGHMGSPTPDWMQHPSYRTFPVESTTVDNNQKRCVD